LRLSLQNQNVEKEEGASRALKAFQEGRDRDRSLALSFLTPLSRWCAAAIGDPFMGGSLRLTGSQLQAGRLTPPQSTSMNLDRT
jgi:hypothetical protein